MNAKNSQSPVERRYDEGATDVVGLLVEALVKSTNASVMALIATELHQVHHIDIEYFEDKDYERLH